MKGLNLPPVGCSYSGPKQIGISYYGPDFSRPTLRQMPRHWVLEETRHISQWQARGWLNLAFWLVLLLGYLNMLRAVLA